MSLRNEFGYPFLNPSSIPVANIKPLSNTLPLFDAVPFGLSLLRGPACVLRRNR
jgi:hypothetical protein